MMRSSDRRGIRALAISLSLVATLASAQTGSPAPTAGAVAISSSRRFIVSGMSSAENVSFCISMEEVAKKVGGVLGLEIPFARSQSVQVQIRHDPSAPRGRVIRAQGWVDRQLSQKLIITNFERVNEEDTLEGLCWLLLNRLVVARQTFEQKTTCLGTVPDWLSTGVAQNLYLALRDRNSQVALSRWREGKSLPLAAILEFEYLPEGRWSEKAFSGLAVDWLTSLPRAAGVFDRLLTRLAGGGKLTVEELSEVVLGREAAAELEKNWDLWLAQQTQVKRYGGSMPGDQIAAIEELRTVRPEDFGFVAEDGLPSELDLRQVIESRGEPWLQKLAVTLSLKAKALGLGEPEEYRAVADRYGAFFDGLAARASRRTLDRLLAEAERGLAEYRDLVTERRRYVTEVEKAVARFNVAPSVSNTVADMLRSIPRSELQRYVDEVERGQK
jgi:hypothetical protein